MSDLTFELSPGKLGSFLANPRPITVALYFRPSDAPKLWDLAHRHHPEDPEDIGWFAAAARSAERGLPAVLECTFKAQLEESLAFFRRNGIEAPTVEELRV